MAQGFLGIETEGIGVGFRVWTEAVIDRHGIALGSRASSSASWVAEVERDGEPAEETGSIRSLNTSSSIMEIWFSLVDDFSGVDSGDREESMVD